MRVLIFLSAFLGATASHADICRYYRKHSPDLYRIICKTKSSGSRPAGAASTISSSFNLNSAALPMEPSSYGVEWIGSRIRNNTEPGAKIYEQNFGLVKGFNKFGAGVSTASANTFYGDSVIYRIIDQPRQKNFEPLEERKGKYTNLNLGTAFDLTPKNATVSIQLGLSGRYNQTTDTWGGGPALMTNFGFLSLGIGATREKVSNFLDRVQFITYQANLKFWRFELEGCLLTNNYPGLRPIPITTLTFRSGRVVATAALRRVQTISNYGESQPHFAFQVLFSKYISAGFLYNYVPGATSLGLQFYL